MPASGEPTVVIDDYRYVIELFSPQGAALGQASILVDWEPAREWAIFCALRRNGRNTLVASGSTLVRPRWDAELGAPVMSGFSIEVTEDEGDDFCIDFSNTYFKELAQSVSSQLIEQGKLKAGERFLYCVLAYSDQRPDDGPGKDRLVAAELPPPVVIREGELGTHLATAAPFKPIGEEEIPVFVPQNVLAEITALSQAAGANETGGVLIGHLFRDKVGGDLFLVVTAQIPAMHTRAEAARLTFTAETWTAVRAAIRLRGRGEIWLGWFHSHPVREWCKSCPEEKRESCTVFEDYFSPDDEALHRTVFPRAWSIALLVSELPQQSPSISMFGWRKALIGPRGFHVLGSADQQQTVENAPSRPTGEEDAATQNTPA
jgi:hypothetical protein